MKKQKTISGVLLLSMLLFGIAGYSQKAVIQKLPMESLTRELKIFSSLKETPFVEMAPLTPQQKERVEMFNACFIKACLHRLDPVRYPIGGDEKSMEQAALRIVNSFSQKRFQKLRTKIQGFANPNDDRRSALLGKFNSIDLSRQVISGDLQARKSPGTQFINLERVRKLNIPLTPSAKYSAMDFIVRALHCVDETDPESPGDDDMLITGTLYEINASAVTGNGFFAGNYDDNDYNNFGDYLFGSLPLSASGGYPKTMYCMLTLVEQDSDESGEQLAYDINNALAQIGGKICDAWYPGCSLVINELSAIVNNIMSTFFDDDYFAPRVISVNLNSELEFGDDGTSENLATTKINGHDGSYKIGYKIRLRK